MIKKLELNMTSNNTPSPYVVSSTSTYKTYLPYFAFDGNPDNFYHSENTPEASITLDLGVRVKLDHFIFYTRTKTDGSNPVHSPSSITVYGSNDNSEFVQIGHFGNLSMPGSSSHEFKIDNQTVAYRYIKFHFKRGSSSYIVVGEIELYANTSSYFIKLPDGYLIFHEDFYNSITKTFTLLPLSEDLSMYMKYALMDISAINRDMTIKDDTFIPIDKLKELNKPYNIVSINN